MLNALTTRPLCLLRVFVYSLRKKTWEHWFITCSSRRRFFIFLRCSLCLLLIRSLSTPLSIKSASRIKSRDSSTEMPPTWSLLISARGTGSNSWLDGSESRERGTPSVFNGWKWREPLLEFIRKTLRILDNIGLKMFVRKLFTFSFPPTSHKALN